MRLFKIFTAESDNSQLVILIIISCVLQLFIRDNIGDAIVYSLLYLGVTWVFSYAMVKIQGDDTSLVTWWKRTYVVVIVWLLVKWLFS